MHKVWGLGQVHAFTYERPIVPKPFVEKTYFSIELLLPDIQIAIFVCVYVWTLFYSIDPYVYLLTDSKLSWLYQRALTLLFFRIILAFLTIFLFQINSRINQLIYIYRKILQGFWLILIKSIVHFGRTDIATMLNLPNHEHSICFHSFKSSLIYFTSIL